MMYVLVALIVLYHIHNTTKSRKRRVGAGITMEIDEHNEEVHFKHHTHHKQEEEEDDDEEYEDDELGGDFIGAKTSWLKC